MTMLSWAFAATWWGTRLGWGAAGFVANAIAWVLSLPFRLVMLAYRFLAWCLLSGLKLADIYWRVLVIEKAMLFSWIIYELVFSLSLLILLKATHAVVWFFRRALWACHVFPEGQGWRKLLKSVSPAPDALCCICLEPFFTRAPQGVQQQHTGMTNEDCCSMSLTSVTDEGSSHLRGATTDDCCSSEPSSASPTPSFITHPSPSTYINEVMLQPAASGLSHSSLSTSSLSHSSLSTSSLSHSSLSTSSPSHSSLSTGPHPSSSFSLSSGQGATSSLSSPYSGVAFSGATSGFSGHSSDMFTWSDDSSSELQPPPPAAAAPLSAPLILFFWLPRPCRVLFLRLLLTLRTGAQQNAAPAGDGGAGAGLGGPLAASSACQLPCGHTFCRPCVTRWLERHQQTCPLCRRSVHPPQAGSRVQLWLASTPFGRHMASSLQPLARVARAMWSVLMALVLCGPFMYAWYYAVRLAGARVGVYHHLLAQSAWADFALCLVLFVRVLHRRCSFDSARMTAA